MSAYVSTGMEASPWECVSHSGGLYWFVPTTSALIRYKQTTIDLSRSRGHLCGCPSGCAVGLRESQRKRRQLLVSPECWDARWLPDWFSGPFPILYHPHFSFLCQSCAAEDLSFGLVPAKSSSGEHLYTGALEVWFMNGSGQECSFWRQDQIMEETEWSNLWPLP